MYKTESMLGLIGSIISAVFTFFSLVITLLVIFTFSFFQPIINNIINRYVPDFFYGFSHEMLTAYFIPLFTVFAAITIVIAASSFILGFVGTTKLNRGDKSGGVLLIVAGALAFITVVGFIPFVLMLVGGIMAVSKKPVSAQSELSKTV